ncbi:MAG: twin-arginine translocase TatA/TatE family subunit [Acidobacteria bacterium]|nr:twin-arginine translocase TatA/TatE family subunit [Acidobacteriota bacterium]MBU4306392.1 twin-arginine translocase TatA/TatE family subunit [Acidobacteriota bacterium]MBU4405350.1 twin-arginine translocase TatA/TatE family subunit [Acidobacteriota bacterium]MCG2810156.1 twin-arginine translocase TatA/TatE family subunit [Candidatus Aminicenantes bacterium]
MFGSIGFPELLLIFIVVLLVFGPKKLPEFAKLLGKTIREFRSTIDGAKAAIEDEIYKEGMTSQLKDIGKDVKDALDIYGDVDKSVKDIGKDIKDSLNIYGPDEKPAAAKKKNKDVEKSKDDEKSK